MEKANEKVERLHRRMARSSVRYPTDQQSSMIFHSLSKLPTSQARRQTILTVSNRTVRTKPPPLLLSPPSPPLLSPTHTDLTNSFFIPNLFSSA
jgi:hypothetical protein